MKLASHEYSSPALCICALRCTSFHMTLTTLLSFLCRWRQLSHWMCRPCGPIMNHGKICGYVAFVKRLLLVMLKAQLSHSNLLASICLS
ncbi:hypothetical protein ACHAXA_000527 [Cyclostephanos tholiformis]|uniref:Uncharacterized protein n=1 Tax=Cyclostephanos tholiformis TaxID=382380 RepID=A0ABD3SSQ9_9STRA